MKKNTKRTTRLLLDSPSIGIISGAMVAAQCGELGRSCRKYQMAKCLTPNSSKQRASVDISSPRELVCHQLAISTNDVSASW